LPNTHLKQGSSHGYWCWIELQKQEQIASLVTYWDIFVRAIVWF
jgi:hypothetical protein